MDFFQVIFAIISVILFIIILFDVWGNSGKLHYPSQKPRREISQEEGEESVEPISLADLELVFAKMSIEEVRKSNNVSEEKCREIFHSIFRGHDFSSVRPDFLRNPETGRCLELDGYCSELKLAFEYNGIQHYKFPNPFHRTRGEFEAQQRRDKFKTGRCRDLGIDLIEIPYQMNSRLEEYIREQLSILGRI